MKSTFAILGLIVLFYLAVNLSDIAYIEPSETIYIDQPYCIAGNITFNLTDGTYYAKACPPREILTDPVLVIPGIGFRMDLP